MSVIGRLTWARGLGRGLRGSVHLELSVALVLRRLLTPDVVGFGGLLVLLHFLLEL